MKQNLLKTCIPLGSLLLLSGCIDNNYDLSDIDKTTQINVTDLTVPVNLEAIELRNIIKLNDDSKIKEMEYNGEVIYAVTQEGTFESDDIDIKGFHSDNINIEDASASFNLAVNQNLRSMTHSATYTLGDFEPQIIEIKAHDIDEAIKSIGSIDCEPMYIKMKLTATGLDANSSIHFNRLVINFLKGLRLENVPSNYSYNSTTGLLEITHIDCPNNEALIDLEVTQIDFSKTGTKLEGHDFNFYSEVTLKDAELLYTVTFDETQPPAPQTVDFDIKTTVTNLVATYFSGQIEYKLEGNDLNIDPVTLNDIPGFLSSDRTNLVLANPQIYLSMNNPLAPFGLGYQTGMKFVSVKGTERETYALNPGELVKVTDEYGEAGPYNFVLWPGNNIPAKPLKDYTQNLKNVPFDQLSYILSGDGMPSEIEISLEDPMLPSQPVNNFKLNNTITGVSGNYYFFAPLALKTGANGAVIVYSDTEQDWSSEDLDKMTLTKVAVETNVYSNLPIGAELRVYPLDKDGNRIIPESIEPAEVPAMADGQKAIITITGNFTEIDGIEYEAVVRPGNEGIMSPDQTLRLENIKAKVTGFYLTDFE